MIRPSVQLLATEVLPDALCLEIRHLFSLCFLSSHESQSSDSDDSHGSDSLPTLSKDFISRLLGFYDPSACLWMFLQISLPSDSSDGGESEGEDGSRTSRQQLIGMANIVPYLSSVYVFNLCVHPALRGRGYGKTLLMHCIQTSILRFSKKVICGSVEREKDRLVGYYERIGGRIVETGIGSGISSSQQTETLRESSPQFVRIEGSIEESDLELEFEPILVEELRSIAW